MITKRLYTSLYNITKGIPWLAQKWPEIQQYLQTGNIYLLGEAPLEALSTREATFERQSYKAQQETEEAEEFDYTLSEEEVLEAARVEVEKPNYIFQQPPTAPPPPLKKSLDKGKQPQFQRYSQRSGDGNQTPPNERSQKHSEKENPSLNSYSRSKAEGRTGGNKKAARTQRPSDDDPDDDTSSEGPDAGRDVDRSGSDDEPDKETAAEKSARSVREITSSKAEWEKITGQKQRSTSAKANKPNKLAKIRDPDNCHATAEKWRDQITLDQYRQLIIKWLKWQEYDIKSEDALERASFLMTGSTGVWYNNFVYTTRRKNRNIHGFLCLLRSKLTPKIRQDVPWTEYPAYYHAQLGINVRVIQYTQGLEQYEMRCLDNEGQPMISNHIHKVKFGDGLLPCIRDKVRHMVA